MSERAEPSGGVFWDDVGESDALHRFRSLVNAIDDGLCQLDREGRLVAVNDALVETTGRSREELLGEDALESVHPDDRDRVRGAFERLLEEPDYEPTVEFRYEHADGTWVALEARGRNLLDDPIVDGIVAYTRDVTERTETERERREHERQLSTLMDNVPGMVYRCRNERGWPMEFVSEGCKRLTGYDAEVLERGELSYGADVVHEEDRDDLWEEIQRGLDDDGSFLTTYRIETDGGDVRWVRERGRGMYDDGNLEALEGVIIDVTERKHLEAELDDVIGRVTDAFYAVDDRWRITHANERAEELVDFEGGTIVGEHVRTVFDWGAGSTLRDECERAMRSQEATAFELHYPDPVDAWYEVNAYPSETGLSVYFRDVTERKRAEQRLEEERDMFAQGPATVFRWRNEEGWPVEYVSENVEDVLGYAPDELESGDVPYTDLLLDEEIDRIAREVAENSDETTERFSHEPYRVETRDGDVRWVKDTTKVIRDETGEITHYLGYLVDITEREEREQALAKYETIVETVNDGIYVKDEAGRFTMVNEAYAELTGHAREDLLGSHASLVVDEATITESRERRETMGGTDDETGPTMEAEIHTADGDRVPTEGTFATIRTADGDTRQVGVVRDVTERKERERELRRTERRFEAIFEDPNILVGLLEPDGTVLDINRTAMEYIEADLEAVRDEPFWETPWWGEGDDVGDDVREWVERAAAGEYVDFQADLTRPDGKQYTLEGFFRPVTNDEGDVVSLIVSDRDVTERKARERELAESERRYRTLAENFPNGIVTLFDHNLEYELAAGQGFEDFPLDPGNVEGSHVLDVWDDETADALEPAFEAALDGEECSVELAYEDREWVVRVVPITDERGDVFAGMTMAQDITERLEYERKLEASNERLEQFAYAASHDLQEPLRMVSSYLQLIEDRYADALDEDGREFLEFAVDGADRMREMIASLLEYSRVETQGNPLEPVDLEGVLDDVLDDLQFRIEEHDAEITVSGLPRVRGDAHQLRQLFQNLLDNALEYSGDEPPYVDVSAERSGDRWIVSVRDDGIGIDADDSDRVFEVFQRLHSREEHEGTGVGLALCQRIVERHGGEIWVESEPGEGSTFSFALPRADE